MSLNWDFDRDFIGTMTLELNEYKSNVNLYDGNALMIALVETEKTYTLKYFFASEDHMKYYLGLTKGNHNMFEQYKVKLTLKTNSKSAKKIAQGFIKARFEENLEIIFKKEPQKIYISDIPF